MIGVITLIRVQLGGTAPAWSVPGADRRDAVEQRNEHDRVVRVGGGDPDHERQAVGVGQQVQLRAGFAPIDRVRSGQFAPFFARTLAASRIARDQSISPRAPSSSSTATWMRRYSPASVHCPNRRCAVRKSTPSDGGNRRHAHPLVSTYTIEVNTARVSAGARPPPCGRAANGGINGSTIAQNSSGTNRLAKASSTDAEYAADQNTTIRDAGLGCGAILAELFYICMTELRLAEIGLAIH